MLLPFLIIQLKYKLVIFRHHIDGMFTLGQTIFVQATIRTLTFKALNWISFSIDTFSFVQTPFTSAFASYKQE